MQAFNNCGTLASADSTSSSICLAVHGRGYAISEQPETVEVPEIRVPRSSISRSYDTYNGGLALPVEIIETIVDNVASTRDLKACALLCTFIRYGCQSRLFRHLTINCDLNARAFKEGGLVYTVAHDRNTADGILHLIKSLNVTNRYGVREIPGGEEMVDFLLGQFVRKLGAIEKLEIVGSGLEWNYGEFVNGMVEMLQFPSLKELKLSNLEAFPMPLILWGHHLTRLELERVTFRQTVFFGLQRSPITPSLQELKMDNNMRGLTLLALHFLSDSISRSAFTGLKKLALEFRDRKHDEPSKMNSLLTTCERSLENLSLFLPHEAYVQAQFYADSIALSRLVRLRSFTTRLFIVTCNGYLDREHPFELLKVLFTGGPPSLQEIRLIIFHRFGDRGDDDAPESSGWKELDLVLARLTGLREVSMMVCCTQCTPRQIEGHWNVYDLPIARSCGVNLNRRFTNNITSTLELED